MRIKKVAESGKSGDIVLHVRVEPRSSRSGVVGPYGEGLKVKLKSPPVEGRANRELVDILSKEYNIDRKDVQIVSGVNSKNKIVRLKGAPRAAPAQHQKEQDSS